MSPTQKKQKTDKKEGAGDVPLTTWVQDIHMRKANSVTINEVAVKAGTNAENSRWSQ